jgi:HTH-type transcriptional regulator/antitoxin HipB
MNASDIGKILRYFRKEHGLSQLRLAQLAGVGKTVVFDLEKGKETVQLNSLLKILNALDIKMKFKISLPAKEAETV